MAGLVVPVAVLSVPVAVKLELGRESGCVVDVVAGEGQLVGVSFKRPEERDGKQNFSCGFRGIYTVQ